MSESIDDRVVGIKFDNSAFERAAAVTMSTLGKLKDSFNMQNAQNLANKGIGGISSAFSKLGLTNPFKTPTQGIQELSAETSKFNLNPLTAGVAGVSKSFIAMSTVAITALSNITSKAISAAASFVKGFTFAPIMDGLHEYETNLKSVQTIQANTDRPLTEINKSLDELNRYSDQTIYNFSEMAKNIGTFTAAGVDLQTATSSIKGIANLAALSGSSSQQAATAMYQLSQAISSGRVGLQDWNSVVNAGMGGKKLQNALAQTAIAMGDIDKSAVKMVGPMNKLTINGGSFRESIMAKPGETPWLSSDILVNTLATMDGRFSAVALAAEETDQGLQKYSKAQIKARIETARTALETKNGVKYTNEQFKALQTMSTSAFEAATKVKTLGQVFDVAKETVASGWSASFRSIFGGLDEAKKLFTGMSDGLNGIIKDNARARNVLLAAWAEDGGRTKMITGLKNAWKALVAIATPIKDAFRAIFPATTAKELVGFTEKFKDFMKSLIIGDETAKNLKRTFKGVFAVFSIIGQIVGAAVGAFFDLFGALTEGSGGLLEFTGGIGVWLQKLDKALKKGETFKEFFATLVAAIKVPLAVIQGFGDALGDLFGGADASEASSFADAIDGVGEALSPLEKVAARVRAAVGGIGKIFSGLGRKIGEAFGGLGPALAGAFTSDMFSQVLTTINTALLGGIVVMIRKFFNNAGDSMTGGFFGNLNKALGSVTETMSLMQTEIKANIILKIAAALGIMAASIMLLAFIPPAKIAKAMAALAAGFVLMVGALIQLSTAVGLIGAAKIPLIAAGMVLLATSMVIFAGAMALMGAIPFDNIVRGLLGMAGMLFIIKKFIESLDTKDIVKASVAMTLLGVAMNLMATAMKIFATMSWEEMGKGMAGFAGSLAIIAAAMRLMPKGMVAQAAAIGILAVAMNGMATALKIFATMNLVEMGKGLLGLAGSLVIVAAAMRLMPRDMLLQSVALNAVASAMVVLSGALLVMGTMSWDEIGRGMAVLGGSMAILAIGLRVMSGTLGGSAALTVAVAALTIMVPVLLALGAMSWESIIKGLTALAGVFVILGVAGYLLAPIILPIMGLGTALLLLGTGLAAAGAAAVLFATAFGIVVGLGYAGVRMLSDIIGEFIAAIPSFLTSFAKGLGAFAEEISKHGPSYTKAITTILTSFLNSIIKNAPKMAQAFLAMLRAALKVIVNATPMIVNAGLTLIIKFLEGISSRIGRITKLAIDITVKFMNAISSRLDKIIQAGVELLLKFLEGIANAISDPKNQERIRNVAKQIGTEIVNGAVMGLNAAKDMIVNAAQSVGRWALDGIKKILGIKSPSKEFKKVGEFITQGLVQGLLGTEADVTAVMTTLGENIKAALEKSSTDVDDFTGTLKDLKKAKREALKDKNPKNDDKYNKDIKKATAQLEAAEKEKELVQNAKKYMKSDKYKKDAADLKLLGQEYDAISLKITEYENKIKEMDQYRDQVASKFNQTPDIQRNTSLASYNRNAAKEKAKVEEFNADLQALLGMGLDTESYNKLLEEGLDAQPFINKLISAGPAAVDAFDQSNAGLALAAKDMGTNATTEFYGVSVAAVQGLLDGANARQGEIEGKMAEIGARMVTALKNKLGIKSPSKAFMDIGKHSNNGLAKGLKSYSGVVKTAAAGVGVEALDTLRISMSKVGEAVNTNLDMNPRIAPVLDLTQMQKEATKIGGMLPESSIVGQVSYDAASALATNNSQSSIDGVSTDGTVVGEGGINYTQIINSPSPISEIAVFRGTRNQLSMKKEELKKK